MAYGKVLSSAGVIRENAADSSSKIVGAYVIDSGGRRMRIVLDRGRGLNRTFCVRATTEFGQETTPSCTHVVRPSSYFEGGFSSTAQIGQAIAILIGHFIPPLPPLPPFPMNGPGPGLDQNPRYQGIVDAPGSSLDPSNSSEIALHETEALLQSGKSSLELQGAIRFLARQSSIAAQFDTYRASDPT